jgi:ATP-binding cassette, subfamily B, bacterial PglK
MATCGGTGRRAPSPPLTQSAAGDTSQGLPARLSADPSAPPTAQPLGFDVTSSLSSKIRGYFDDYSLVLGDARKKLRVIGGMMLVLAALDTIGVGLIAPFAQMLATGTTTFMPAAFDRHPRLAFLLLGLTLALVFLVKALLGYRMSHRIASFTAGYRAALIRRLMSAYQAQSWQYHLERNSSELVTRVFWYTETYASGTLNASLQLVTNAIVCLALFILLAISDIQSVAIMVVALGAVFFVTHHVVRGRMRAATTELARYNARVLRGTKQALEGFREVRILGVESNFRDEVAQAAQHVAKASARAAALQLVPRYAFEVAVVTVLLLIGLATALRDGSSASAVPVLGMFAAAAIRVLPASTALLASLNQVRSTRLILGELAAELRGVAKPIVDIDGAHDHAPPQTPFESLELSNVHFSYPKTTTPVLAGVNLTIRAGDTIGLMGRSGAGKSTLADIILGFFSPDFGEVRVNGENIHKDLRAWLRRATYIPQSVFLIDDTLRRNIEFGVPESSRDPKRMSWAIERAQLAELVARLPDGLETFVGEEGTRLSGGQRQRVALARALYHEREFIVLDEATSALDAETEDAVVKAVIGLAGSKTLFVIAHRQSTLSGCSVHLTLRDGQLLVDDGATRASADAPAVPNGAR